MNHLTNYAQILLICQLYDPTYAPFNELQKFKMAAIMEFWKNICRIIILMAVILANMMAAILNLCNPTNETYLGSYNRYIYQFEQNRLSGSKVIGFCSCNGGHIGSHDGGHLEFL